MAAPVKSGMAMELGSSSGNRLQRILPIDMRLLRFGRRPSPRKPLILSVNTGAGPGMSPEMLTKP